MLDEILGWPLAVVLPTLWAIAMARSNATYWLARGAHSGYRKIRHHEQTSGTYQRASALVNKYGAYAVAICFLTIGLQTAVLLAAGATRMPMRRFLPAAAIGSSLWAVLYATIGLAVVQAWLLAAAGHWWVLLGLIAVILVGVATWMLGRRPARRAHSEPADTHEEPDQQRPLTTGAAG